MNFDNQQRFFSLSQRGSQRTELSMNYGDDHYPIKRLKFKRLARLSSIERLVIHLNPA